MEQTGKPTDDQLAQRAIELLFDNPRWMIRRKETITIRDDEALRRVQSVDFECPPPWGIEQISGDEPIQWLPLFMLPKLPRQYSDFDFEDENGRSLPLPTREENGKVSAAVLRIAAERAIETAMQRGDIDSGLDLSDEMIQCLTAIAECVDPQDVEDAQDRLDRLLDQDDAGHREGRGLSDALNADDCFRWAYQQLASSSIVVVPLVGEIRTRKLVKLSFDEVIVAVGSSLERLGWDPYALLIDLPFVAARTYHLQVQAPPGMQTMETTLSVAGRDQIEADVGLKRRVHLYLDDAASARRAVVEVQMRLRRDSFANGAVLAAIVTAAALTYFATAAADLAAGSSSVPSLLLALQGAIAAYASRLTSHPLTGRLLRWARGLLLASAGLAFSAAAIVASHVPQTPAGAMKPLLFVFAVIAWVLVWMLWLAWRLPLRNGLREPVAVRVIRAFLAGTLFQKLGVDVRRAPAPTPQPTPLWVRVGGVRGIWRGIKRRGKALLQSLDQSR